MKILSLIFALALCLLTSCVSYKPRSLSADSAQADFTGRSLSDAGLQSFLIEQKAGRGSWNVDRIALAAAYFHPDMALARAEANDL